MRLTSVKGVKGLAMVTGSTWAVHRKIIAPCLQAHSLKQFHDYVERSVQRAVDRISIQLEHSGEKKVKLDMYTLFKKLSLDTVGYIVTGEPLDCTTNIRYDKGTNHRCSPI